MNDLCNEFMEYDFAMGADMVKCPHCGGKFKKCENKSKN